MFEVGQKVLCVDDQKRDGSGNWQGVLKAGKVYTVAAFPNDDAKLWSAFYGHAYGPTICLAEIYNGPGAPWNFDYGFYADRFRPLNDPSIELFRKMARDCDVPVRALEGP